MTSEPVPAPPLRISRWFNTDAPITLASLRGRTVLLHAFQMLCPACVSHGLPQTLRARELFAPEDLAVIGLHTVFEHHAVMSAAALEAFVAEYHLSIPIGIDEAHPASRIPLTMQAYRLDGTPSIVLLDRRGRIRLTHFGLIDDMAIGGVIGRLIAEPDAEDPLGLPDHADRVPSTSAGCDDDGCAVR